jgi:hypothetical protein
LTAGVVFEDKIAVAEKQEFIVGQLCRGTARFQGMLTDFYC